MFIIRHRTFFFWVTGLLLAAALGAIAVWGLPLGIDFTGGTMLQVNYPNGRPAIASIQNELAPISLGVVNVRASGATAVAIRTRTLSETEHEAILTALSANASTTELAYTSVGPSLGSQFTSKAIWAIIAVVLVIVFYIGFVFRKVPGPVPGWAYGLTVVAMLAIDIIVPTGFFAAYAHYTGAEVDSLFIVALLSLLGYCVNDVIVIFDRIREHLAKGAKVFGAESTRTFALVMLVGVAAGTFSSIARSAPLLIPIANWLNKGKK